MVPKTLMISFSKFGGGVEILSNHATAAWCIQALWNEICDILTLPRSCIINLLYLTKLIFQVIL